MITVDIVNQLFPNIVTVIVQLCSTLVLFLVAKKFLWKSVKNWMNVRAEKMQADLSASQKAKEECLIVTVQRMNLLRLPGSLKQ